MAQGYLMLAGGASESAGGWSDAPYLWVVEHAQNKRIAIITYDNAATDWIPNYFKGFGAKRARNFIISNRASADIQSLYDSLITYTGVFIKGGDQKNYYDYYKGTKTQQALQYIYNNGGVLSGTSAGTAILSPIVYTAQVASVDPSTALLYAYSNQITLANDFLTTLTNKYIFDTHFIERGRFGRLPSFMATWFKKSKENTTGIGVDDHTAICIDPDGKAKIYGTAAINFFYNTDTSNPYDTTVSIMRTKTMKLTQLIHGSTIDLNNGNITGLNKYIEPEIKEENGRYTILFNGSDYPIDDAYSYFVNSLGSKSDITIIVTGSDMARANDAKSKLEGQGATQVQIIQAISSNLNDSGIQSKINSAKKIVVIGNDYTGFIEFLKGAGNGVLLNQKLKQSGMISFFIGDNARFIGKTVTDKYRGFGYTSYHGTLEFKPGIGLLETTAIMPNAFITVETYENTVSGLPYAMVSDSLKYGLYITGSTFAEYGYTNENKSYYKNIGGSYPLILLENNGTYTGTANQGPYATSRNVAGFESMNLKYLGVSDTVIVGKNVPLSVYEPIETNKLKIYPNPTSNLFYVQGGESIYSIRISDLSGRNITSKEFVNSTQINLEHCAKGIYLVNICDLKSNSQYSTKLCLIK